MPARTGRSGLFCTRPLHTSVPPLPTLSCTSRAELLADPGVALGGQRGPGRADDADPQVELGQVEARPTGRPSRSRGWRPSWWRRSPRRAATASRGRGRPGRRRPARQRSRPAGRRPGRSTSSTRSWCTRAACRPGPRSQDSAWFFRCSSSDAAVAVHDRLRPAGGARGEQHDQRVVEGHRHDVGRAVRRPRERRPTRTRTSATRQSPYSMSRTWRTLGSAARICVDLGPTVDVLARRSGSRRRRARTTGSTCSKRSITLRAPNSIAQLVQTAPRPAAARKATSASGVLGRYPATRSPARTPRSASTRRARATWSRSSPQVSSTSGRAWERAWTATASVVGARAAQRVLGVVEQGAREPAWLRASRRSARTAVRWPWSVTSKNVPDRRPEALQVGHRPAPERLVVGADRRRDARRASVMNCADPGALERVGAR